ncbi:hypothetical protein Baya_13732 [Bagarius yarrelli]|uniref:Uncharacterized protein n=1 Tax=Bagarius yarrelli TaxID=175774 RepID=A0A556V6Y1_BAGYA|nr:hypothetical protein Baya_13732 [Bagarius yarrelli]
MIVILVKAGNLLKETLDLCDSFSISPFRRTVTLLANEQTRDWSDHLFLLGSPSFPVLSVRVKASTHLRASRFPLGCIRRPRRRALIDCVTLAAP